MASFSFAVVKHEEDECSATCRVRGHSYASVGRTAHEAAEKLYESLRHYDAVSESDMFTDGFNLWLIVER